MKNSRRIVYLKSDSYDECDNLLLDGIREELSAHGAELCILSGHTEFSASGMNPGIQGLLGAIRAINPDGVLAKAWLSDIAIDRARTIGDCCGTIPILFMGEGYDDHPYTHLKGYDYTLKLLDHLRSRHGRKRIAFISSWARDDRDEAYLAFTQRHGIQDEGLYILDSHIRSDSVGARAARAVSLLFDTPGRPHPDAIFSMSAEESASILKLLQDRGIRVPDDVALASSDDSEALHSSNPPITAVGYPYWELGRKSAETLLAIIEGETVPRETKVETRIFYRESCGCSFQEMVIEERGSPPDGTNALRLPEQLWTALRKGTGSGINEKRLIKSAFIRLWGEALRNRATGELRRDLGSLRLRAMEELEPMEAKKAVRELELAQAMLDETVDILAENHAVTAARNRQDLEHRTRALFFADDEAALFAQAEEAARVFALPSCWMLILDSPIDLDTQESESYWASCRDFGNQSFRAGFCYSAQARRQELEGRHGDLPFFLSGIEGLKQSGTCLEMKILHLNNRILGLAVFEIDTQEARLVESLALLFAITFQGSNTRSSLIQTQERLTHLAEHDSLTGLGNRYAFYQTLRTLDGDQDSTGPEPGRGQLALFFIDLDEFKPVNDSWGHEVGDLVLRECARRVRTSMGDEALGIFRIGGDEFTVLARMERHSKSRSTAKALIARLEQPIELDGRKVRISASIGCAHFPRDCATTEELVRMADLSMYRAKETKGTCVVYDPGRNSSFQRQAALSRDIRSALDRGEIEVLYQGIYSSASSLAGIEALARWNHPGEGLLLPGEFLPLAKQNGMIIPIDIHVLREGCRRARELTGKADRQGFFILVNCSNNLFFSPDFTDIVSRTIEETGIDSSMLRLGLEERFASQNPARALSIIANLGSMGIQFAVEGFGGESSWLNFILSLKSDTIVKVEKNVVDQLSGGGEYGRQCEKVLSLFEAKGFKVALSGIESEDQREKILSKSPPNCLFQGFALAQPQPFGRLDELLDSGKPKELSRVQLDLVEAVAIPREQLVVLDKAPTVDCDPKVLSRRE